MPKTKSLLDGIGNENVTEKYYDDWAINYDQTLKKWNYKAPKKAVKILGKVKIKFDNILDLACGTGMFAEEIKKKYKKIIIDGCDISEQSLQIAKQKQLYRKLYKKSFEKKIKITSRYDLISMIGSMTYCQKPNILFSLVNTYLKKNGVFIFSHRIDLWEKQNFDALLEKFKKNFTIKYCSRPLKYLPENTDFSNKIKIRLVVLKKI